MSKRQSSLLHGNSVSQERLINALNLGQKSDGITPVYGIVKAVNEDGSFGVQLSVSADLTRCAPFCYANVGDRVLVLIFNGKCAAIARDNTGLVTNDIVANGTVHIANTTDVAGNANNDCGLIIGDPSGAHMALDTNEILAKSNGTTVTDLWLNETGNTYINNCLIAKNKVLWSGCLYMTGSHTATLSQSVSAQANGIVLVWSAYADGTQYNYMWIHNFIPKHQVSAHNGTGCSMHMVNNTYNRKGTKYVYVHNTKLTGNDYNDDSDTNADGLSRDNNYWVLRYVIGV